MTEKPGQTKTQTHKHTHAQTHTNTNENGGTAVKARGLVQLPMPDGGATGQTEGAVQLLFPDPVNKPSLAQPAKNAAGPAGSKKLPPEPAVNPVNAAVTAE